MALPALSERAQHTVDGLRAALPPREFAAVYSWLHTFYRFQLEWILDWARFMLALKSRQIGISHTIAGAAVLWGMFGETTTVISLGQREADEVLAKSKLHASALARLGSQWAAPLHNSATKLVMRGNGAGGGRILSLPNTSAGRSFSGNVILDELAYYDRPHEVWDGAAGTALHGYRLRGLSTPNGAAGLFYDLWSDPKQHAGYSLHAVTLDEAIADGMDVDIADCWKLARGDERVFNQLFRCSFLDNEQQYIPTHLVEAARVDSAYIPHGECYAGLDIGKTADRTELVIVRRLPLTNIYHVVHNATCKRTSLDDIHMLADRCFAPPFNVERLCIDRTGMGEFPAEEVQNRHGEMCVEPVPFSPATKEDMATRAYGMFNAGQIRMPRDNEQLYRDTCSIRRVVTTAGNVAYEAPRTAEGHGDSFWALALALRAANAPVGTKTVLENL